MRVGVHTSIAGALTNAAHRAHEIGCDAFQIFSANPRGWHELRPSTAACAKFCEARAGYKLLPLAIHANYLINLAAADPVVRLPSVAAFRRELQRAMSLRAEYVVLHPGSAKNGSPSWAVKRFVQSLLTAAKGLQPDGLTVLIENTAGQGSALGFRLEELAEILAGVQAEVPAGVCIDTAHLFAAGYAIHTPRGLSETVRQLDSTLGLANVRLIHANDSKSAFASRVDRHQHIGDGQIGAEAFRRIVRHPKLRAIPFICETPKDKPDDDRRNVEMMRLLARSSRQ
ncbi:MAG TPA: deoxyribonuclease IV [Terriglobia bacterium]|nr:deoxyribonuclease IV [Terriglobia bacterium]